MRANVLAMRTTLLAASACLLATGCDRGSAGSREARAPDTLSVEPNTANPDLLSLRWTAAATPDAWRIEISVEGGPWRLLDDRPAPEDRAAAWVLDSRTPDGLRTFRIRAVVDGSVSPPSPEASYVRPVRSATDLAAWLGSDGRHHVTWVPRSPNGSPLLERRFVRGDGAPGAWSTLLVEFDGTYTDADTAAWSDGARFEYRLTHTVRDLTSDTLSASGPVAPPLPLASLSATVSGGVVHVAWTYPGFAPVDVSVKRGMGPYPWQLADVGTASTPESSLDDPLSTPGVRVYEAQARLRGASPWDTAAASVPLQTRVLVPDPAWTGVVGASLRTMPLASCAARDSSGRFVLVRSVPAEGFTVHAEGASGFDAWDGPEGSALVPPCALVDGTGRIHVLYRAFWAGAADILHRWRDGEGWHEERVTTAGGYGSATLDRDGNPALAWYDSATRWARMEGGGWIVEPVPAPFDHLSPGPLAFDPAGDPAFVAYGPSLVRRSGGTWSATAIPGAVAAAVRDLWAPAVNRYDVGYAGYPDGGYWIESWAPAGWSAAEQALSMSYGAGVDAAATPDGSRIVVAAGGAPATLAVRDAGVWRTIPLVIDWSTPAVGFHPDGRWWALFGLSGDAQVAQDTSYVLYEEP